MAIFKAFRNFWSCDVSLILPVDSNLRLGGASDSHRSAFPVLRFVLAVFLAFIEPDGRFQNQENIVPGSLDLSDRGSNAIGVGQRFIDRVAKLLHQLFEFLFHALPLSLQRAPSKNNTLPS